MHLKMLGELINYYSLIQKESSLTKKDSLRLGCWDPPSSTETTTYVAAKGESEESQRVKILYVNIDLLPSIIKK